MTGWEYNYQLASDQDVALIAERLEAIAEELERLGNMAEREVFHD